MEIKDEDLVPVGSTSPKDADVRGWTELLANQLAAGESAAKLRSYLKKTAVETWDYVNWLTHAKNAVRMDAEIALKIVEHLLGTFTAARLRLGRSSTRCEACGSYRIVAGRCTRCDHLDPEYQPAAHVPLSDEERARRLSTPCTPSSDIDTLISPHDYLEVEPEPEPR